MKCIKCSRKSQSNFRHIGPLCRECFLKVIEKRLRKDIRASKAIQKNDKILLINNESKEYYVGEFLLKSIIKQLPVKIDIKKSKSLEIPQNISKKYGKIIIPWSLDDEAEEFLNEVVGKNKIKAKNQNKNKKKIKKPTESKKEIRLLKNISEEEIAFFAKIKRFKYKTAKLKTKYGNPVPSRSKTKKMLDELEKKYPGYKFSLLNSIKQVKSL